MNETQNGFSVVKILILIVFLGILGGVGWLVYDRQSSKTNESTPNTQTTKSEETVKTEKKSEVKVPEGWTQHKDTATGVSFYHPADWDMAKIKVQTAKVSETVTGTNFKPYMMKYNYNTAEKKWYMIDSQNSKKIAPHPEYTTQTTTTASPHPAIYGYGAEGAGEAYYVVFTDGINSYMIELPVINGIEDATGLSKQKQSMPELMNTILIKG